MQFRKLFSTFVGMSDDKRWPDILDGMSKRQKIFLDGTPEQTIYSARKSSKLIEAGKKFKIRTDPGTDKKFVIRTQ